MSRNRAHFPNLSLQISCFLAVLLCVLAFSVPRAHAGTATTSVFISVCGDAVLTNPPETCDRGVANNTGLYATSTMNLQCFPDCSGFGPYCGDGILQPLYGEECDDGNNTPKDRCSSDCKIENLPSGSGGGGGFYTPGSYAPPRETRVVIQGKAYPNVNVNILKDGQPIGVVQASANADFYFTTTNVTPGVATFAFWAQDSRNLRSSAFTTTLTVIQGAVTTISGAYLPPTISVSKRKVAQGETLTISGTTIPNVGVETHVNSESDITQMVSSSKSGAWRLDFDTSPLQNEEFHSTKALFQTSIGGNVIKSAWSEELSFYVGTKDVCDGNSDINNDNKVNLVDFSILLYHWNSTGPAGDLNCDNKVNLTDFSILLFNWTG